MVRISRKHTLTSRQGSNAHSLSTPTPAFIILFPGPFMLLTDTSLSAHDVHQARTINTAGPVTPSVVEVDKTPPKPDDKAEDDDEDNKQCDNSSKENAKTICGAEVCENSSNSNSESSHSGEEGHNRSGHGVGNNNDNNGNAGSTCNANDEGSIDDDSNKNYDNDGNKGSEGSHSEIVRSY
jgi:hypothetical protein